MEEVDVRIELKSIIMCTLNISPYLSEECNLGEDLCCLIEAIVS